MYACALYAIQKYHTDSPGRGVRSIREGWKVWLDECMHACRLFIEWVWSGFGSLFGSYFHPLFFLYHVRWKSLRMSVFNHKFQISLATAGL